ncbi:hypothetical protein POJ06DRAFT_36593 [Lipomyces tetrasporus]|uniref:DNA repair protein n=1 Tax=Lipomyces tetrasporus TaxID=54092 RepID=A0AAD7QKJ0_9ASCO|nr:uncharacterized protein POJ06DRAFT_36593 [Lipomyces tetrasporus]KAJ8096950.1 hypothetical protein POJ06DRAFT_36593 [Lipomyces tetrasporus]
MRITRHHTYHSPSALLNWLSSRRPCGIQSILTNMVETRAGFKRKRSSTCDYQYGADKRMQHRRPTVPSILNTIQATQSYNKLVAPTQKGSSTSPRAQPLTSSRAPIFTIGHGTRTLSTLIDLLQSAYITKLVDVRSIPRSRTNPQFNHDALSSSKELQEVHIDYIWLGFALGGRRSALQPSVERHTAIRVSAFRNYAGYMSTPTFREGLEELIALADKMQSDGSGGVAIMCSETLWWRCHRRMIADALVVAKRDVQHLGLNKGAPTKHVLWNIARIDDDGGLIYDVRCDTG